MINFSESQLLQLKSGDNITHLLHSVDTTNRLNVSQPLAPSFSHNAVFPGAHTSSPPARGEKKGAGIRVLVRPCAVHSTGLADHGGSGSAL